MEEEWIKYQEDNSKNIITTNCFNEKLIKYIGGLDISFHKTDNDIACGYLTVMEYKTNKIVYEDYKVIKLTIPYISGFLAFREIPVYVELLDKLKKLKPEYYPDVIMIDGCGILHPRLFGSASHLGLVKNIPSIGISKTLMCIDGLDERTIKNKFRNECKNVGEYMELIGTSGKCYGVAFKSTNDNINPIYISIGHQISLNTAIDITLTACVYRIPEPIRNSDIKSKLHFN